MNNKKSKISWQMLIFISLYILCIVICTPIASSGLTKFAALGYDINFIISFCVLFTALMLIFFMQIIIHETGHLIFGLLTGYKFVSFRVGSLILIKKNGKFHLKKFYLAGTAGQCLLSPPENVDGKMPYLLYNFGGVINNSLFSLITLLLYFIFPEIIFLSEALLITSVTGITIALTNGIPLNTDLISNDGYNALTFSKDHAELNEFWLRLKVNEMITNGMRCKDIPEELFKKQSDNNTENPFNTLLCNRLMDEHRFDEATEAIETLIKQDNIAGLTRNMFICELIYCELIGQNRPEVLDKMMTEKQKNFIVKMRKNLTIMRTEYAYTLLAEKDTDKADYIRKLFDKAAKTYPYEGDYQCELELIEIAEQAAMRQAQPTV